MRNVTLFAALEEFDPVVTPAVPQWPQWYGFDFDGTLVEESDVGNSPDQFGTPIQAMVDKAKALIAAGKEVRIFTARVAARDVNERNDRQQALGDWSEKILGTRVKATNEKDPGLVCFYDNRCRQVVANTGELVGEVLVKGEFDTAAPAIDPAANAPTPVDGVDPAPDTPAPTEGAPAEGATEAVPESQAEAKPAEGVEPITGAPAPEAKPAEEPKAEPAVEPEAKPEGSEEQPGTPDTEQE